MNSPCSLIQPSVVCSTVKSLCVKSLFVNAHLSTGTTMSVVSPRGDFDIWNVTRGVMAVCSAAHQRHRCCGVTHADNTSNYYTENNRRTGLDILKITDRILVVCGKHLTNYSDDIRLKPAMLLLTSFTLISMRKLLVFERPRMVQIAHPSYLLQPLASSDYSHPSR
jgi:hypothetical protein